MEHLNQKIRELYSNGIVNFSDFFSKDFLTKIKLSKNKLFEEFPYGQDDNLKKNKNDKFIRPGSYMIWDVIDREPLFKEFVSNKNINMYLNYTTFIQTTDNNNTPDTFMIGYNIKTIDGKKIYIKESYIGD